MMKHIWMCAACLLGSSLTAETIGNVEFQFPPSNYEWKLLIDDSSLDQFIGSYVDDDFDDDEDDDLAYKWGTDDDDDDDYDDEEDFDDEEESFSQFLYKVFTHREGDALEIFVAHQSFDSDDDFDDLDKGNFYNLETAQEDLNTTINRLFPNHKVILHAIEDHQTGAYVEWELNDGTQDLMHGYTRVIFVNENGVPRVTSLSYFTTASATEYNHHVWTNVLNQIRLID